MTDDGGELNCSFLIQNIPGLKPKFLHSAFVSKSYVLLIVYEDIKPGDSLGAFQ